MSKIDKNMTIGELLNIDQGIAAILMSNGMHCVGCPSSAGETLEEASFVHGMDATLLEKEINDYLESNN